VDQYLPEPGGSIGGGATNGTLFAFCIVELLRALGYEPNVTTNLYYGAGFDGTVGAVSTGAIYERFELDEEVPAEGHT
jgi:hypothetical protein